MKEVALVVGGTSGIGKAQVERFKLYLYYIFIKHLSKKQETKSITFSWVKEGYEVVFCGRNEEKGSEIALENKGICKK